MSHAAEELLLRQNVNVYAEPKASAEVIATLEPGDRVPISPNDYGRFRKVLVDQGGKKRVGYVLKSHIESSRVREKKSDGRSHTQKTWHARSLLGLAVTMSYSKQGEQEIVSEGFKYQLSAMAGTSVFFGFNFSFPIGSQWALRADVNFRRTDHTGSIKPSSGTGSTKDVLREITFFGMGGSVKYYFSADGDFWVGGGIEIAKANNVNLVYGSADKVPVNEADYPTYIMTKGGVGYDFGLYGDFVLTPELKVFTAMNTTPSVFGGELTLTIAYAF